MHAVFCHTGALESVGVKDWSVHVFETYDEAREWALAKLLEAGELTKEGDVWKIGPDAIEPDEDPLDAFQWSLEVLEFFHIYEAFDHRIKVVAT